MPGAIRLHQSRSQNRLPGSRKQCIEQLACTHNAYDSTLFAFASREVVLLDRRLWRARMRHRSSHEHATHRRSHVQFPLRPFTGSLRFFPGRHPLVDDAPANLVGAVRRGNHNSPDVEVMRSCRLSALVQPGDDDSAGEYRTPLFPRLFPLARRLEGDGRGQRRLVAARRTRHANFWGARNVTRGRTISTSPLAISRSVATVMSSIEGESNEKSGRSSTRGGGEAKDDYQGPQDANH